MKPRRGRDEGAVMVLVAIMMVVLLAAAALVIDIGTIYVEDRSLQNGADAAALAVARDCAGGDCGPFATTAEEYADANAGDENANVTEVCGDDPEGGLPDCDGDFGTAGATGWVKVVNQTETDNGDDEIPLLLVPAVFWLLGRSGADGATREKTAVAAWGALGATTTLNFIFSKCEWEHMGGNLVTGAVPSGRSVIYSDNIETERCDSGSTPGNFGWIDSNAQCLVSLAAGGTVSGNTGNNSELCDPVTLRGAEIVLPLYSTCEPCNGTNALYTVAGFVGFRITGYYLSGRGGQDLRWGDLQGSGNRCDPVPGAPGGGGNLRCFVGVFTEVIRTGAIGTGPNYGASVVKLIG